MHTRLENQAHLIFLLPQVSKNAGQKKLGYRGVKLSNSLDKTLESKSLILFKKKLQKKSFTTLRNYLDHSIIENQDEN